MDGAPPQNCSFTARSALNTQLRRRRAARSARYRAGVSTGRPRAAECVPRRIVEPPVRARELRSEPCRSRGPTSANAEDGLRSAYTCVGALGDGPRVTQKPMRQSTLPVAHPLGRPPGRRVAWLGVRLAGRNRPSGGSGASGASGVALKAWISAKDTTASEGANGSCPHCRAPGSDGGSEGVGRHGPPRALRPRQRAPRGQRKF